MNSVNRSCISVLLKCKAAKAALPVTKFRLLSTTASLRQIFNVQDMEDFEKRVMKSQKAVLVDFHADWCQPCKALTPRLEKVVDANGDEVDLAKLNVDEFSELAMQYNVNSIPTVIAFKGGEKVNQFTGLLVEDQLSDFVASILQK